MLLYSNRGALRFNLGEEVFEGVPSGALDAVTGVIFVFISGAMWFSGSAGFGSCGIVVHYSVVWCHLF